MRSQRVDVVLDRELPPAYVAKVRRRPARYDAGWKPE